METIFWTTAQLLKSRINFEWTQVKSKGCNEIKQQIKSPGEDGIWREILKRLDEEKVSRIHNIIERVW